ncbi:hypothetical protein [Variovorax saccharolyticus]|uniref:hypothetical protein n=1 Tax=Variovorax saccharolyticus TaxID=3053516 RepID=UPI0025769A5D|nr:hypothetical protein [Variovorax sp. J31P216]MDM0026180.1 hypothetical protein [Variovorax sp. J31P216]
MVLAGGSTGATLAAAGATGGGTTTGAGPGLGSTRGGTATAAGATGGLGASRTTGFAASGAIGIGLDAIGFDSTGRETGAAGNAAVATTRGVARSGLRLPNRSRRRLRIRCNVPRKGDAFMGWERRVVVIV